MTRMLPAAMYEGRSIASPQANERHGVTTGNQARWRSEPCVDCGVVHTGEERAQRLARLLERGRSTEEILNGWSHIWGQWENRTATEHRRLQRDKAAARKLLGMSRVRSLAAGGER